MIKRYGVVLLLASATICWITLFINRSGITFSRNNDTQSAISDSDWQMYGHDLAGSRYSKLTQISKDNVSRLVLNWRYNSERPTDATPIVINNVMYFAAGDRIVALEASTGKELWYHRLPDNSNAKRGISFWAAPHRNDSRLFVTTPNKLVAIEAHSGESAVDFGEMGIVNLDVPYGGVPTIYKNLVIVGATPGNQALGASGDTRAYDALSGKLVWRFHSVPAPGERGHDTWLTDGWMNRSGANVWAWYMTVDLNSEILYMPFGAPNQDYWGGDRPGDNLFGNSLVAVNVNTGSYLWHYQTIHHDLWDLDLSAPPALVDVTGNGSAEPLAVLIGKSGLMFIFNRLSGKLTFGATERPVPTGSVPGEWYSTTQPFPDKPAALATMAIDSHNVVHAVDTMQEHAEACAALVHKIGGLNNKGAFTPFPYHRTDDVAQATVSFPGNGGADWGGVAIDPVRGIAYVFTQDVGIYGWVEPRDSQSGSTRLVESPRQTRSLKATIRNFSVTITHNYRGDEISPIEMPCQKPPWGLLSALDLKSGNLLWQYPLGVTDALAEDKKNTGRPGKAGAIVTAGDLLFIGSTDDHRFRAIESQTGRQLWEARLNSQANSTPITYADPQGNQFVAIVADSAIYVYSLR